MPNNYKQSYRRGEGIRMKKEEDMIPCESCGVKHKLARCKYCNYKRYYRGRMTHNKKCKCSNCHKNKNKKQITKK